MVVRKITTNMKEDRFHRHETINLGSSLFFFSYGRAKVGFFKILEKLS